MSHDEYDENHGCLLAIAIVAISIGIGEIWGAGYGWLFLGGTCLAWVVWDRTR